MLLFIRNHTVFLIQFGINLYLWVFQKAEIALAEVARAISVFWKSHLCNLIPNWAKNCMITFINISELLFSCHLLGLCKSDDIDLVQVNFKGVNLYLEYNTPVNSAFRTHWLNSSEVISQVLFISEQPKKNKMAFVGILSQIKLLFGPLVSQLAWYILHVISNYWMRLSR